MKKGLIFATTLAMALGVGVAVSAHQGKAAKAAKAWSGAQCGTTWYIVGSINDQNWDTWNKYELNDSRYEFTFTATATSEFKLKNVNSWDGGIEINSGYGPDLDWAGKGWNALTNKKDGGNFVIKAAGKYTVYFDKNITSYENGVWAFGIEEYVEPATGYDVTCVVDGKAEDPIKVEEGQMPAVRGNHYDATFDGWYKEDSYTTKVTAITEDCSVYGRYVPKATASYTLDDGIKSFSAYKLYAWDAEDNKNAEWPGVDLTSKTIEVPIDASFIINDGSQQTVNISQEDAKQYLRLLNETDDQGHYKVSWEAEPYVPDVPAEDGYYLQSSVIGWKYATAIKMTDVVGDNVAQIMNQSFAAEEEVRVRSYFDPRLDPSEPLDQWANPGNGQEEYGEPTQGGNFKITVAGNYDVYAKYENGFKFYVAPHAEPVDPDVPAEDGYYIVSTDTEFKYEGALKMTVPSEGDDKAQALQFTLGAHKAFKVRSYFDGNDEWYNTWGDPDKYPFDEKGNYINDSDEDVVLDIYLNKDYVVYVSEHQEPDVPAEDGYYLQSSVIGWKYATAIKMTDVVGDNVAQIMNQSFAAEEEVRVRSYFDPRLDPSEPLDQWANPGNGQEEYGEPTQGGNFKITVAGNYDVYAKYENGFKFFVAPHVDSFEITMVGHKTTGIVDEGEFELATQYAYADSEFVPDIPEQSGYACRGVFTDEECETPYQPKEYTAAGTLYVLYTKVGYYLAGGADQTFSIDTATLLHGDDKNKIVGTVVVPAGTTAENPYKVKPLEYAADAGEGKPGWKPIGYEPGYDPEHAPDFVHFDEDSNFAFTEPGTYAFYVNHENKVWFNGGLYAFVQSFLDEIGGTCNEQGKTNLTVLHEKWEAMEVAYGKLSPEEQQQIKDKGFNGGDEHSEDDLEKMIAKYAYIVTKYGAAQFNDFIWNQNDIAPAYNTGIEALTTAENNTMIIVISAIAASTAIALGVLLVLKKRKHQ